MDWRFGQWRFGPRKEHWFLSLIFGCRDGLLGPAMKVLYPDVGLIPKGRSWSWDEVLGSNRSGGPWRDVWVRGWMFGL